MSETVSTVLVLLCLLQLKHMFADYFLQTPRMLSGRGRYWHMGRAQHAAIHAAGSMLVLALIGAPATFIVAIVLIEWVVHFNIDWGKAHFTSVSDLTPSEAGYWRLNGVDQALHHLTYLAMAWAWVEWAGPLPPA